MFLSTLIRYSARKVKTSIPSTQTQTINKQQNKTKFQDDQLLQIAGYKPNSRSTVKMFQDKIGEKVQNKKKLENIKNIKSKSQQQTNYEKEFQDDQYKNFQQDDDKVSYQKSVKSSNFKQKYKRYKSPHVPFSQRAKVQQLSLKQLSKIRLQPQFLPNFFMQRVQKVFHKYSQSQLREISLSFSNYNKLRYSQQKIDYQLYSDLGFNKLQLQKLPGGQKQQQQIYLIGRNKIYQNQKQNQPKLKKIDEQAINPDISYTQNIVISYLLLRMPKTYSVASRILTEIKYKFNNFIPKSIIDFGSGLGAGGLAFIDIFDPQCKQVYGVEPSPKMRKMNKYLNQNKIQTYKSLGELSLKIKYADIVYAGYVINQIDPDLVQVYLQSLWSKVAPQGFLILVEHGNPFGSRIIHEARKWILNKQDVLIAAPCPHHMKCPLARLNEFCHFDQPSGMYPRQIFGKLPNDNQIKTQKFSYLVIQNKKKQNQYIEQNKANVTSQWDRILFPLIKRGRHFGMNLCMKNGSFQRRFVAKSHGDEYIEGRKLRWGDLWRFGKRIPNKFRKERKTGKRLW